MPEKSKAHKTDYAISKDGTKIGYRIYGNNGPGLILVHGGIMGAQNFDKLAGILAENFTVYVHDRRGRGLSANAFDHSLALEVEDIQAIIGQTGAVNIFGLSSGAIVTLQTALTTQSIQKIAVYEPPLADDWSLSAKWYQDYENAVVRQKYGKALIKAMRGMGDKSWITRLPVFIIAPILNLGIRQEEPAADQIPLKDLITAFKDDYRIAIESKGMIERCRALSDRNVLLIEGAKSFAWIKSTLKELAAILPDAKHMELPKCVHNAADNGESPEIVARALKDFFIDQDGCFNADLR